MRRIALAIAAVPLLLASETIAAEPVQGQAAPAAREQQKPKAAVQRKSPVPPVAPVSPVTPVDAEPENPPDTEFPKTVDPMMGVPPLGQSREWRERIKEREEAHRRRAEEVDADKPDVLLDIPDVSVEEISLEINNVTAHLSLDAKVANLVKLTAGVDVGIERVKLLIKGVHAEALLKVRLKHVAQIVDRALTTIDRNPQLISQLLTTVEKTVTTVGEVAKIALAPGGVLSQTVNMLGQTVQKVVDTTGRIVERTLDTAGTVINQQPVGDLADLKLIRMHTDKAGNIIKQVRGTAGEVIEYTASPEGTILNVRLLPAEGGQETAPKK